MNEWGSRGGNGWVGTSISSLEMLNNFSACKNSFCITPASCMHDFTAHGQLGPWRICWEKRPTPKIKIFYIRSPGLLPNEPLSMKQVPFCCGQVQRSRKTQPIWNKTPSSILCWVKMHKKDSPSLTCHQKCIPCLQATAFCAPRREWVSPSCCKQG